MRTEAAKDRNRERARQWYLNHKDRARESARRWREKRSEEVRRRNREYQKAWRAAHPPIPKPRKPGVWREKRKGEEFKGKKRAAAYRQKMFVLSHYGGTPPRCACCGEGHDKFLTIDHVGGGGKFHQTTYGKRYLGYHLYKWLERNGFPPGFRVLCLNCNFAIGKWGTCAHEDDGTSHLGERVWVKFADTGTVPVPVESQLPLVFSR